MADFSFSSFCAGGTIMGVRGRVPLPEREREMAAGDSVCCVGSFEGWLVGVKANKGRYFGDRRRFLMNSFSRDVIRLPLPSGASRSADAYTRSLPIINGSGVLHCTINAAKCVMLFWKVVLSSSPDSGSKCVVAATSMVKDAVKLALWRPGMKSWSVCYGNLHMLSFGKFTTNLLVFEICEDDNGLMVSRVESCVIKLPGVMGSANETWSIVEWRGKLLIVVTYFGEFGHNIIEIRVYEVDCSTNPATFTEMKSLDGDCNFISQLSSKSFRLSHYDVVKDDLIYFMHGRSFDKSVYNMKDGTMTPITADMSEDKI
uniref:KIB1-4 beta-propeller domain-containing protein n=1 Tax=Oryza nivara TaxID=4536 RepID=A0A0E0ISF7_ORYNI